MVKKGKESGRPEVRGLVLGSAVVVSLLCLLSYDTDGSAANWLGLLGHGYAWLLLYLFGLTAYPHLAFLGWVSFSFLVRGDAPALRSKAVYLGLLMVSLGI